MPSCCPLAPALNPPPTKSFRTLADSGDSWQGCRFSSAAPFIGSGSEFVARTCSQVPPSANSPRLRVRSLTSSCTLQTAQKRRDDDRLNLRCGLRLARRNRRGTGNKLTFAPDKTQRRGSARNQCDDLVESTTVVRHAKRIFRKAVQYLVSHF